MVNKQQIVAIWFALIVSELGNKRGQVMTILVTGGAGFIGSNFVLDWLATADESVVNLDKLTYAGNLQNLAELKDDPRHSFIQGDIGDYDLVLKLLQTHQIRAVINFAAESHVDRSIHGPDDFIQTNSTQYPYSVSKAASDHLVCAYHHT
jgi:dTDP-glucose 4,6-dehydratase